METIHTFRSYVVKELVDTQKLAQTLGATHSQIDPKAAITQQLPTGTFFAFNFGSIVFCDVPNELQITMLARLTGIPGLDADRMCSESFSVVVTKEKRPGVEFNRIILDELTDERAEVIAGTLAQSTTMEYYEALVEESWSRVDENIERIEKRGKLSAWPYKFNKQVGASLALRNRVVRVLHLLDRPDLIWDDSLMDSLYPDLRAMFDLQERFQALEYKLQLIQESWELLVDTSRDQRLYWLEAAIVLLIVFEIVITLFEKLIA